MGEKKDESVRLSGRDRILGGVLARAISGGGPNMTECPSMGLLSEFMDGKLTPDARAGVVAHLGGCADCYAVVSASLTIREELLDRSRARRKRYVSRSAFAVLAAAAVLLLVLRIWPPAREFEGKSARASAAQEAPTAQGPRRGPDFRPPARSFAGDLAARLAGNGSAAVVARLAVGRPKPRADFGFSSAVPLKKTAFRIGACLTDLEVALDAKDREKIDLFAKRLAGLLETLENSNVPVPPAGGPRGTAGSLAGGPGRYEGLAGAVEASFRNRREAVYLKFGAWVEAAGLAADARDAAFFRSAEIRRFREELKTSGVPPGPLKDLSQLESILSSDGGLTDRLGTAARLLADIKEMF